MGKETSWMQDLSGISSADSDNFKTIEHPELELRVYHGNVQDQVRRLLEDGLMPLSSRQLLIECSRDPEFREQIYNQRIDTSDMVSYVDGTRQVFYDALPLILEPRARIANFALEVPEEFLEGNERYEFEKVFPQAHLPGVRFDFSGQDYSFEGLRPLAMRFKDGNYHFSESLIGFGPGNVIGVRKREKPTGVLDLRGESVALTATKDKKEA